MEIHSMRIDHGPVQTNTMSYPQRQTPNHRSSHNQPSHAAPADIYKPSRSPLSSARYPYPSSPQLQHSASVPQPGGGISQVCQRYPPQPTAIPAASATAAVSAASSASHHLQAPPPPPLLASRCGEFQNYRQNRISLLHSEYGRGGGREHLPAAQAAGVVCVDAGVGAGNGGYPSGQQPLKKIRLQDKEGVQPLRIDTREQPGTYNPQVEAISPTLPDQMTQDDQAFRITKDELIQQIGKVDREIAKAESQIGILKKKQAELEEIANKPTVKSEVEEVTAPKHQSLPQQIYAENRKRAQTAHARLEALGPKVEFPLYNQPSDAPVYPENKRKNMGFKKRLLEYFKQKHTETEARNTYITDTYSKMMQEWLRKVDKIESSTKRKAKDARNREFFEKVFPELRKQREDKERNCLVSRFNRVGARVKSEADMEEIMDNLQEQALEDKKMRSYAVIPPMMHPKKAQIIKYENTNGFIEDMESVYKSRQFLNVWTASEKEIFKDKYLQHPKNFGLIAASLEKKSVSDCVQYYYLSKKTENYKQLFRKARQRNRNSRNPQKVNNSSGTSVVDILTSGVTTRLRRELQAKNVGQTSSDPAQPVSESNASTSTSTPPAATTPTPAPTTTTLPETPTTTTSATTTTVATSSSSTTTVLCTASSETFEGTSVISSCTSTSANDKENASPTGEGDVPPKNFLGFREAAMETDVGAASAKGGFYGDEGGTKEGGAVGSDGQKGAMAVESMEVDKEGVSSQEMFSDQNMENSTSLNENKKKKERRKEMETSIESSDEEPNNVEDKTTPGTCIVCQAQLGPQLHSRPLGPTQGSLYGLREDQIPPNSRVCNTCRCKSVRSRYTNCPLPTCPNSRGRVKRLRSFPYRLQELPNDVRESLLAEFRIPSSATKCCSACYNRIQRRLGPVEDWPEEEINKLKVALSEVGSNWQLIGERLNKPAHKVKLYFTANRKKLKGCLDDDRKPSLSTDEESGSSTSSCEEPMIIDQHSSDTASAAESPPVQGSADNAAKRIDYDSSATETADEAQTPDHYQGSATITPVINDGSQPRQNTSPLSVKDLVLNVIEISLMKNAGTQQQIQNPPVSGITPTITSILNNDSNEVTIVSEYNLNNVNNQQRQAAPPQRPDINIAKLVTPLIAATITPVSGPIQSQPQPDPVPSTRDDLIVLQVPDGREPETLDLSLKKPRELPPPAHSKHQPQQQQQTQMHRSDPYMYHQERKSPAFSIRSQPKLPSPKPANPKSGSITLGTPIMPQTRYEVLRQMPEAKMGSITQGTPVVPHNMQDKRMYDYYSKRGPMPSQANQGQALQYPGQQYNRQPAYTVEQQLSSRQIIINDYITSQQMIGRRNDKPQYYPASSAHCTPPPPPPPSQSGQQQRQGVIHRHSRPQYLQPGHEALSSLVDVAVQQPSLPVPSTPHEGLGKTMADNMMEQPHRYQIIQQQQQMRQRIEQQQQQQRMDEQRRAAFHQQQQQQQQQPSPQQHQPRQQQQQQQQQARPDNSTLTAASLIDAIITHQINQTAEGGREVVANSREQRAGDLLFQKFHRGELPPQQGQDNGERPPSVISVDLDGESINKNLTVKELTDSVISHDFSSRQNNYYHLQESMSEQYKRRMQQQQQHNEDKRAHTPYQDERQIIRIAQPSQKYHLERLEPVSPPDNNHWSEQNFRRYPQSQPHISPLDYVKNRIAEVMRTEDDKKEVQDSHLLDKDRDSPGEMVIDEEKHENDFGQQQQHQQQQGGFYSYVHKESSANDEPKPLLSAQYEPLSDED